jgi:hypothetical protein
MCGTEGADTGSARASSSGGFRTGEGEGLGKAGANRVKDRVGAQSYQVDVRISSRSRRDRWRTCGLKMATTGGASHH